MVEQVLILISQTILVSVPFVLAALGGTCSERGGVVNIALEGILLGAAFTTARRSRSVLISLRSAATAAGNPSFSVTLTGGAGSSVTPCNSVKYWFTRCNNPASAR